MARSRAPAPSRLKFHAPPSAPPVTVYSPRDGQLGIFTGDMRPGIDTHYFHESLLASHGYRHGVTDRGSVICTGNESAKRCTLCSDLTLPRAIRKLQRAYYVPGLLCFPGEGWRWAAIAVPGHSAHAGAFSVPACADFMSPKALAKASWHLAGQVVVFRRTNRTRNGVLTYARIGRRDDLTAYRFDTAPVINARYDIAGPDLTRLRHSLPWPASLKLPETADGFDARRKPEPKPAEAAVPPKLGDRFKATAPPEEDPKQSAREKARAAKLAGESAYAAAHGVDAARRIIDRIANGTALPGDERGAA